MQADLDTTSADNRAQAAQIYQLKAQLEQANDAAEGARKENKTLAGARLAVNEYMSGLLVCVCTEVSCTEVSCTKISCTEVSCTGVSCTRLRPSRR